MSSRLLLKAVVHGQGPTAITVGAAGAALLAGAGLRICYRYRPERPAAAGHPITSPSMGEVDAEAKPRRWQHRARTARPATLAPGLLRRPTSPIEGEVKRRCSALLSPGGN